MAIPSGKLIRVGLLALYWRGCTSYCSSIISICLPVWENKSSQPTKGSHIIRFPTLIFITTVKSPIERYHLLVCSDSSTSESLANRTYINYMKKVGGSARRGLCKLFSKNCTGSEVQSEHEHELGHIAEKIAILVLKLTVIFLEMLKHVEKDALNYIHDLTVMLLDSHLKVQASELTKVSVCIGVFSPTFKENNHSRPENRSTTGACDALWCRL